MVRPIKPNVFRVRLTDEQWTKLEKYAESKQLSAAEVVRSFIDQLPEVATQGD